MNSVTHRLRIHDHEMSYTTASNDVEERTASLNLRDLLQGTIRSHTSTEKRCSSLITQTVRNFRRRQRVRQAVSAEATIRSVETNVGAFCAEAVLSLNALAAGTTYSRCGHEADAVAYVEALDTCTKFFDNTSRLVASYEW